MDWLLWVIVVLGSYWIYCFFYLMGRYLGEEPTPGGIHELGLDRIDS